jgi:hypothetical protein
LSFTAITFSIWHGWRIKAWQLVTALLCDEHGPEPMWVKNAQCFPLFTLFQLSNPSTVKTWEPPRILSLFLDTKKNRQYARCLSAEYSNHDGKRPN